MKTGFGRKFCVNVLESEGAIVVIERLAGCERNQGDQ